MEGQVSGSYGKTWGLRENWTLFPVVDGGFGWGGEFNRLAILTTSSGMGVGECFGGFAQTAASINTATPTHSGGNVG